MREVWRPKEVQYPSPEELNYNLRQSNALFPLPLLERPVPGKSRSSRIRHRFRRRITLWRIANNVLIGMNALHDGGSTVNTLRCRKVSSRTTVAAQEQAHREALAVSKRFAVERRGDCPTGVRAVASLLKLMPCEAYLRRARALSTHQSFVSDRIDEPKDNRCVDMLQALPESERLFYSNESNVVDLSNFLR